MTLCMSYLLVLLIYQRLYTAYCNNLMTALLPETTSLLLRNLSAFLMRYIMQEMFYTNHYTAVNLCDSDINKAFDRMHHHGLLIKLMSSCKSYNALSAIEDKHLLRVCGMTAVCCHVRIGSLLSFAIEVNDVIMRSF